MYSLRDLSSFRIKRIGAPNRDLLSQIYPKYRACLRYLHRILSSQVDKLQIGRLGSVLLSSSLIVQLCLVFQANILVSLLLNISLNSRYSSSRPLNPRGILLANQQYSRTLLLLPPRYTSSYFLIVDTITSLGVSTLNPKVYIQQISLLSLSLLSMLLVETTLILQPL